MTHLTPLLFPLHHPSQYIQSIKSQVIDLDFYSLLNSTKLIPIQSMQHVYAFAASFESSWPKVLVEALEEGPFGSAQATKNHHGQSVLYQNCNTSISDDSLSNHFRATHTDLSILLDECVHSLISC